MSSHKAKNNEDASLSDEKVMHKKMSIGERLKEARLSMGLNQIEFANEIGIKLRSYQANERGKSAPGALVLDGCVRQGISADWILTGYGSMFLGRKPRIHWVPALCDKRKDPSPRTSFRRSRNG